MRTLNIEIGGRLAGCVVVATVLYYAYRCLDLYYAVGAGY